MADENGSNFVCECFIGWTGEFCDVVLVSSPSFSPMPTPTPEPPICDTVNCSGNAECTNLEDGSFNCLCYVGWTGDLCEIDIDFCETNDLLIGDCSPIGTAMCVDGNSTHMCICVLGFTGDLCSIDIDNCNPNPCFNNATCVDSLFGVFTCHCAPGFTGMLCNEPLSPCDPNPCMEPYEVCITTGPGEDDFMCVTPPATATTTTALTTPMLTSSFMPASVSPTPNPTPVAPNSPPMLRNPIGTIQATEGQVTNFIIPEVTFFDPESGTTSNLRLTLLDFNGNELSNTTWIHIDDGAIQALPLRDQAVTDLVTEYTFILRASDERGASTHDLVTIRVLRQPVDFQNFLVVMFEGSFTIFSQNLTDKISLFQGLSAHSSDTAAVVSTSNVYIRAFRNGSIATVYRDISISDTHCAEFRAWVATVYSDSNFTPSFIQSVSPRFVPTSIPVIEGPCNMSDTNPTVAMTPRIIWQPQSDLILFLATVIPTVTVACLCLLVGMILFASYHSRRAERSELRTRNMRNTFTHRRPVILDEEWDLPNRRRLPVILPSDRSLAPRAPVVVDEGHGTRPLLEELDYGGGESESSDEDEYMTAPRLSWTRRNRYATVNSDAAIYDSPPPYEPPPLFNF